MPIKFEGFELDDPFEETPGSWSCTYHRTDKGGRRVGFAVRAATAPSPEEAIRIAARHADREFAVLDGREPKRDPLDPLEVRGIQR